MQIFRSDHFLILILVLFIMSSFTSSRLYSHECIAFNKVKTILEGHPNKPIKVIEENISLESAYCVQEKLNFLINRKFNDKIGYKVGFTGQATQERFKVNSPAVGTLYKHMFIENNSSLDYNFGYRPVIEPDLMVIVKSKKIMDAKSNMDILKELESIHPFIEIASLRYEKGTKITGNMLIAANMLATKMVMGEGLKVDATEKFLNQIKNINTIFKDGDGKVIQELPSSNLMQNPINVIAWLIAHFKEKNIELKSGDRISLGSIGKIFPLKKNMNYYYTFEGLDKVLTLSTYIN